MRTRLPNFRCSGRLIAAAEGLYEEGEYACFRGFNGNRSSTRNGMGFFEAWHPEDRVLARWIKGNPLEGGSICDIKEYIQGKLHKMKVPYTKIVTAAKPRRAIGA